MRRRIEAMRSIVEKLERETEQQKQKEAQRLRETIHSEMTRTMLHENNIPGSIAPPPTFGEHPSLIGANRNSQVNGIFGNRKRFNGDHKKDDYTIHELLADL